jgi:hypothetical protein
VVTYDPVVTSFIMVGVVGGVALVLNVTSDWEVTFELARATDRWTAPLVTRNYDDASTRPQRRSKEASILGAHGYRPAFERGDAGVVTYQLG